MNASEYEQAIIKSRSSAEWLNSNETVNQIRKAINSFDDGLLTPGDVINIVAVALNDWADKC
jgi:hypothetical protein